MAGNLARAKALLEKTLTFLERRFNQEACELCHSLPIGIKEFELAMKFFKDNGIMFDPERTADALDAVPDLKAPPAGFPDVAAPRFLN